MRTDEFKEQLQEAGASWTTVSDSPVVRDYGDFTEEYRAVVAPDGLAIADRSERETVVALGTDAIPLIQGLVTGNVFQLAEEGSGQYNLAVNVKGRLVTDMRLLHIPEMLLIDLEPGAQKAGAIRHFRKNVINEDAKFLDRTERTGRITVLGGRAAAAIASLGEWHTDVKELRPYHGTWGVVRDQDIIIQRNPDWGVDAFDLIMDIDSIGVIWSWFKDQLGATTVGNKALEVLRIENGTPRFGAELDETIIPLEADLEWAISFDKGCYLGQEIIARLDSLGVPKQMLRLLVFQEDVVPTVGADVKSDGKVVGKIRSAVMSPKYDAPIALAYLKRDHNEPGGTVTVGGNLATIRLLTS